MNILIFKTDIRLKRDLKLIKPVLSADESILRWNVDRQDADKILRVESTSDDPVEIIRSINKAGYRCEELQD